MTKRFLGILAAVLIMSVTFCFGVVTVSAEEVPATTISDNALDDTNASVDESTDEDITEDEMDEDSVDDEEITDDETEDSTEDDMADTETQITKPSPTTGDTVMPALLLALALLSGGTAVAGYKVKKSK